MPGSTATLTLFLLLTAFSNGCTAMTGVEAVSNGVPAFRPPESRNAAATLVAMAALAITMFLGITLLAHAYGLVPTDSETVVSQVARATSAAGLALLRGPGRDDADSGAGGEHRVCRLPATGVDRRARPLPPAPVHESGRPAGVLERHPDSQRAAAALLVIFDGDTHALIPLYMIGVFVSFTLSQAGMVSTGGRWGQAAGAPSAWINGFGAIVTGIVLVIVAVTKAAEGAWIILVMIPVLVRSSR